MTDQALVRRGFPNGNHRFVLPASHYDDAWSKAPRSWQDVLTKDLVLEPGAALCKLAGGPVLDVGCGIGHLGQMLAEQGVPYALGMDTSAEAIRIARQVSPKLRFVVGHRAQLLKLLTEAKYKTVALLEVLEHVPDDLRLLAAIPARKQVVISVPNYVTAGHVRWFRSAKQARVRYKHLIRWLDWTETEARVNKNGNKWFIMRGVRRR